MLSRALRLGGCAPHRVAKHALSVCAVPIPVHRFSAAAAAPAPDAAAAAEDHTPLKWRSVIPADAVTYESTVPPTVWDVGVHNYRLYHAINKVTELLSDPDTAHTPAVQARVAAIVAPLDPTLAEKPMIDLQREMGRLSASADLVAAMCASRADIIAANTMAAEAAAEAAAARAASDEETAASWDEMAASAAADAAAAADALRAQEPDLLDEVLPKDHDDERSALLEVRAGTGGDEAALFAREIFHMYENYSSDQGWRFEAVDITKNDIDGYREAIASLQGTGVFGRLKFETGVHRVQRIPVTETTGRVHTSTVTVAVLPEVKAVDIEIKESDIRVDLFRARGAGGQHVNTTDSAVRLTHIPTGVVVQCQDERNQHKNKERAMGVLRARIYTAQREAQQKEHAKLKQAQIGTGDRSERIRTYNFPQSRVTDHRINHSCHSVEGFLDGTGLEETIEMLRQADRLDRMRMSLEPAAGVAGAAETGGKKKK